MHESFGANASAWITLQRQAGAFEANPAAAKSTKSLLHFVTFRWDRLRAPPMPERLRVDRRAPRGLSEARPISRTPNSTLPIAPMGSMFARIGQFARKWIWTHVGPIGVTRSRFVNARRLVGSWGTGYLGLTTAASSYNAYENSCIVGTPLRICESRGRSLRFSTKPVWEAQSRRANPAQDLEANHLDEFGAGDRAEIGAGRPAFARFRTKGARTNSERGPMLSMPHRPEMELTGPKPYIQCLRRITVSTWEVGHVPI